VSIVRWNRLKARMRSCKRTLDPWGVAASVSFGIFTTAIGPAISDYAQTPAAGTPPPGNGWVVVAAVSVVGLILSSLAYLSTRRVETDSIEAIVAEMDEMQAEYDSKPVTSVSTGEPTAA
jgi:hypothetical protein